MVVSTTLAIAGSVETFNQTALHTGLAAIFGIAPDAIILSLRAGSILVDVRLQVPDLPTARQIFGLLSQPTAAASLSASLGIPIQRVTTPEIIVIATNSTLAQAAEVNEVLIVSLSLPLGLLACLLFALLVVRLRRRRRVGVDYSPSPVHYYLDANELSRAHASHMIAEQYGGHQRMPPPHEMYAPAGTVPTESGSLYRINSVPSGAGGTASPNAIDDNAANVYNADDGALHQCGRGGLSKGAIDHQLSPHERLEAMRALHQSLSASLFAGLRQPASHRSAPKLHQPPSHRSAPKRTALRTANSEGILYRPSLCDAPSTSSSFPAGGANAGGAADGAPLAIPPDIEQSENAVEGATSPTQHTLSQPGFEVENQLVELLRQQSQTFDKERMARTQEYGAMQDNYERRIQSLLQENERQRHLLQHSLDVLPQEDVDEDGSVHSVPFSIRYLDDAARTPLEVSDPAQREAMADTIAAHARGYSARKDLHQARYSATTIGAHARGSAARKGLHQAQYGATTIGAHARGNAARKGLHQARSSAITIGAHARGFAARNELHQARSSATAIAAGARARAARRDLQQARDSATFIGAHARGSIARRELDEMRHAHHQQQTLAELSRANPAFPQTLRTFF